MKKIAIMGYGTVGSGVAEALSISRDQIAARIGDTVVPAKILDLRDFPGDPFEDRIIHDVNLILEDPEIEVVVETMGGLHPAYEFTKQAITAGKSVVTSNKQLVEAFGAQLAKLAEEKGVSYLFEASVAGGIPILRTINTAMIQEKIEEINGILNGTTNYILDLMENAGADFEEALQDAKDHGFAERDSRADVDGLDAARKLAIMGSMACSRHIFFEDIRTRGIRDITLQDMQAAEVMNGRIKLIASYSRQNDKTFATVEPMFLPSRHPLANVNGVYNAVMIRSSLLGDSLYYGKGAGKLATASAVVADVLAVLDGSKREMNIWSSKKEPLQPTYGIPANYMLRVQGMQLENSLFSDTQPIQGGYAALTYSCSDDELQELLDQINQCAEVRSVFRVLEM